MNEEERNSIEKVENLIKRCDECKLKECINCETNYTEITSIKRIVDSYKRLLKENETLKKEKEQAWEEWNNLEQGSYETEQKLKQQIKELQKENEELLELKVSASAHNRILELEKENEELHKEIERMKSLDIYKLVEDWETGQLIPIQKVKAKIEELDIEISTCEYADDDSEEYKQEVEKNKAELLMAKKVLQQLLDESERVNYFDLTGTKEDIE